MTDAMRNYDHWKTASPWDEDPSLEADEDFKEWMSKVDKAIQSVAGVGADDLTDWAYRDAFEDGCNPEDVAADVLAENGFSE